MRPFSTFIPRRYWLAITCAVVATVGIWEVGSRVASRPATSDGPSLEKPNHNSPQRSSTRPLSRTEEDHSPQIVLPLKIVNLLNTQVIEEDTGEVTHKFFEQFQIRQSERAKVRAAIGKVLEEFRVIEASKAKLISTEKDTFVRLEDCSKEVEGIFTAMVEELEPSFGSSRAVGMEVLLRKQLRHGGTEPMEIGLVKTDGGQYLLSKRTFDQHGFRKSLEETAFLASGSFSELNRWKCLEQIYQSATP